MYSLYVIINLVNTKLYIGKTKDFSKRIKRHLRDLKKGEHHSIYLQRAFDQYGEDNFDYCIVQTDVSESDIVFIEEKYISLFGDYNISPKSCGGDLITNHPNYTEICLKHSENGKKMWSSFSNEKKQQISESKSWVNNPMFGKKHSDETRKIMSEKHYSKAEGFISPIIGIPKSDETKRKLSEKAKGKIPWNKGLTLGELPIETKSKISEKLKGRKVTHLEKKVYCEGVIFDSLTSASKHYGISVAGMLIRVNSKTDKMKEFYYI